MGPARKSRSVNKKYSYISEVSPSKDRDGAKRSNTRKRKLSDMLGPRWSTEELTRFYDVYRKHGKDWKKVAGAVRNRSSEMVETLYTMNRAYLSLPHGTASAAGLIAMMTDHYSNLVGSDSDQESNDRVGSSRKMQKRALVKIQPTSFKALDEQLVSHSQTLEKYGCLSLLKKKRSGGSIPRPVGKRTPRFSVSYSYENIKGEKYVSPTRQGLKIKATANDDEVAHEVAIALAEASQRGGSPQVSRTPSKRAESVMSSPFRHAQRKHSAAEMAHTKLMASEMDEEDIERSAEADTGELSRYRPYMMESGVAVEREKGTKVKSQKFEDGNNESHLDDIKEECNGTEKDQRLSALRGGMFDLDDTDAKISWSRMQTQRKKSKKVLFGRDEDAAFDALQTLADLSVMMPTENENESGMQIKDEDADHNDESLSLEALPANQPKKKCRSSGVRMKGYQPLSWYEVASSKASKSGKVSIVAGAKQNQDHQVITKTSRRKQKMQASKEPEARLKYPGIEAGDAGKKLMTKGKKSLKGDSPTLLKVSENFSSSDLPKEGSDSTQSAAHAPVVNRVTLPTKVRSRRKINLKNPEVQKDLKYSDTMLSDHSCLSAPLSDRAINFKEKLSSCLSNQLSRRWCTYEWFYSAIDYPWFAKKEFVEYLYHVGLGHVPRLTRVEWGVIRSSLGKPRRFSVQFLKEEKEKLNQYRDSVRKHYTELRDSVREGLPTDLARPLSVGQHVIAVHPKTREIHDGSVLTVDHSRCRVQFDCPELGVEFVKDIDCMPLNPYKNMPALFGIHALGVDKFFENFNELNNCDGICQSSPGGNLDNCDGICQSSPLANPASLKQTKVVSTNANVHSRMGTVGSATYQQAAHSQPSSLVQIQAKEADVQALAELTRALDKKEAIVLELRRMNDDVLENQKGGGSYLKDSESFKRQYASVLIKLNETNDQVYSAIHCLRDRNTYQGNCTITWPRPAFSLADRAATLSCLEHSAFDTMESGSHVEEITGSSRSKAETMVNVAVQAISSLKVREDTLEKIEETIDYVNDRLLSDDSCMPVSTDGKMANTSDIESQIPSELITKCVATLLMIQKCTERQFPPSDVAQILDSAVTSLHPRSPQNLLVYTEIQKCMGIIRNQILALIPT